MAAVGRGEIGQLEPFANGHVGGIHKADIELFILRHQHGGTGVVLSLQFFDTQFALCDSVDKRRLGTLAEKLVDEVCRFRNDEGRDDQLASIAVTNNLARSCQRSFAANSA